MISKVSKIAIVGCGFVGSSTAFSLVTQGVCDEVLMVDVNEQKAIGEVLDLRDSIKYLERNVKINHGSLSDCGDADIVVLTAGAKILPGQTRLATLDSGARIMKAIVEPIMESGFEGIFIVIANPVDMLAHYVYKLSGLPKNQVIGTGTALDTSRLQNYIAEIVNVDPRSVSAYSMGEHGDSQMVPWSTVTVAGKSLQDIIEDHPEQFGNLDYDEIVRKTVKKGWEIVEKKGTTYYGIATTCVGIIKAILYNENIIIPVSTLLEGEYGVNGVFAGVPAILNHTGVSDILEMHMTQEELLRFQQSTEVIRKYTNQIINQ